MLQSPREAGVGPKNKQMFRQVFINKCMNALYVKLELGNFFSLTCLPPSLKSVE